MKQDQAFLALLKELKDQIPPLPTFRKNKDDNQVDAWKNISGYRDGARDMLEALGEDFDR